MVAGLADICNWNSEYERFSYNIENTRMKNTKNPLTKIKNLTLKRSTTYAQFNPVVTLAVAIFNLFLL